MRKKLSRLLSKNVSTIVSPWDEAISDAEELLQRVEGQKATLKRSIEAFQRMRDAGEPWPGTSEEGETGKAPKSENGRPLEATTL